MSFISQSGAFASTERGVERVAAHLLGCLLFGRAGLALCLRALLFRLLCADAQGENATSQKRHALSYVNSK